MTLIERSRAVLIGAVAALAIGTGAQALEAPPAPLQVAQATGDAATHPSGTTDTGQTRNAARSRMRECGHQWSSMKKNGSAAGMTWKDFSQGCLAKQ